MRWVGLVLALASVQVTGCSAQHQYQCNPRDMTFAADLITELKGEMVLAEKAGDKARAAELEAMAREAVDNFNVVFQACGARYRPELGPPPVFGLDHFRVSEKPAQEAWRLEQEEMERKERRARHKRLMEAYGESN